MAATGEFFQERNPAAANDGSSGIFPYDFVNEVFTRTQKFIDTPAFGSAVGV